MRANAVSSGRILMITVLFLFPCFSVSQISFNHYQAYPVGSWPEVVCIADVNNDGWNDVVLGTSFYFDPMHDYKIYVFLQDPFTGLSSPAIYPYSEIYHGMGSMDVADVNNDHRNDVIIGFSDSIGIFFQNSAGLLDPVRNFHSGRSVDGVKAGDLNHDGLMDIAVSHWNTNYLRVFYQDSLHGFITHDYPKPQAGYDEIEVADMNGDGLDDVVFMAGQGIGGVHIFTQNNAGTLNSFVSYFVGGTGFNSLNGIGVGDLNNDGRCDIAASMGGNIPSASMGLWYQNPATGLMNSPPEIIPAYEIPESNEVDDLNCDGKNEIIIAHGGWDRLTVFSQNQAGKYGAYQGFFLPYASHYQPEGISVGDINRDGRKDVAIADYNSGLIILINSTMPDHWDTSGITISTDTIIWRTFSETSRFSGTTTYTRNKYRFTRIDTFEIIKTYHEEKLEVDSVLFIFSNMCGEIFGDTVHNLSTIYSFSQIGSDTLLVYTHIDSVNIVPEISVRPNPTDGPLVIDLPVPFDNQELKYIIYNGAGALIHRETSIAGRNRKELNLQDFASGAYILVISTPHSKVVKKIVVSK